MAEPPPPPTRGAVPWRALIGRFLQIGVLGFGGPQAHLALLRDEIVAEQGWVEAEPFEEGLALCEALPGPVSSQMAIYLGWLIRGPLGGVVSGLCFLLPGAVTVLVLSELWRQGQAVAGFATVVAAVKPVVAAVIWSFAFTLLQRRPEPWQRATAVGVFVGVGLDQVSSLSLPAGLLLLLAGVANLPGRFSRSMATLVPLVPPLAVGGGAVMAASASTLLLLQLFGVFCKTSLLVFGGGLVMIPLLQHQVVSLGWLSGAQFPDAVAIGQISPGPVVLTSTFVGYQAGWAAGGVGMAVAGATVATVAVFLPSFLFILMGTPLLQRLRRQVRVQRFLAGVLAGVPGAVAAAAVPLTVSSAVADSWPRSLAQLALFLAALLLSRRLKPEVLVLMGIGAGLLAELLPAVRSA